MIGGRGSRGWFTYRRLPDQWSYLRWTGLFEFLVSPDGHRIHYHPLPRATAESFHTYLLGQVLSFSLLAFGQEPLHGTAVVVDGEAIAFLGGPGSGKSTLGAAFLAQGHSILTDDVLVPAPGERYTVHAGIPRIKLFPSVARRVLGLDDGGPRLNDGTSKQVLPLEAEQTCRRRVPLAALYVLSEARPRGPRIVIEDLTAADGLLEVIRNSFNTIVLDRERLVNQFTAATRLVARVPIKRLTYPRRLDLLPAVCDAVLRDG